jgi:hypothetical protein
LAWLRQKVYEAFVASSWVSQKVHPIEFNLTTIKTDVQGRVFILCVDCATGLDEACSTNTVISPDRVEVMLDLVCAGFWNGDV